jgi:hypothetical protein
VEKLLIFSVINKCLLNSDLIFNLYLNVLISTSTKKDIVNESNNTQREMSIISTLNEINAKIPNIRKNAFIFGLIYAEKLLVAILTNFLVTKEENAQAPI